MADHADIIIGACCASALAALLIFLFWYYRLRQRGDGQSGPRGGDLWASITSGRTSKVTAADVASGLGCEECGDRFALGQKVHRKKGKVGEQEKAYCKERCYRGRNEWA